MSRDVSAKINLKCRQQAYNEGEDRVKYSSDKLLPRWLEYYNV